MQVNHYFDDNVLSIGLDNAAGHHTVGVMNPGRYEFSTSQHEQPWREGPPQGGAERPRPRFETTARQTAEGEAASQTGARGPAARRSCECQRTLRDHRQTNGGRRSSETSQGARACRKAGPSASDHTSRPPPDKRRKAKQ